MALNFDASCPDFQRKLIRSQQEEAMSNPLSTMPPELLGEVLKKLDTQSLKNYGRTDKVGNQQARHVRNIEINLRSQGFQLRAWQAWNDFCAATNRQAGQKPDIFDQICYNIVEESYHQNTIKFYPLPDILLADPITLSISATAVERKDLKKRLKTALTQAFSMPIPAAAFMPIPTNV